jgi:glyoxylase-like metal-dependent hydrolase (beta-lactamase superfamily II)
VGRVNVYLIEDEPLTLVDTGPRTPETLEALERALAGCGRRIADLELILLTHHHSDHAGLADELARRSGAEVAALDRTAAWLAELEDRVAADDRFAEELMRRHGVPDEHVAAITAARPTGLRFAAPAQVTVPLADGDELCLRDRTLRLIHRPGHSPTDTLFLDAERRLLFGGDHLLGHISSNPIFGAPTSGEDPATDRPAAFVAYLDALRATQAMDLEAILPGHGDEIRDHAAVVERRLRTAERRAAKIRDALADGPLTAHAIAHRLWGTAALTQTYMTLCEVLGHLDLLIARGEVVEEADGGARVFRAT